MVTSPDSLRFYAVQADGIFMVNETAVYRFSSDCDEGKHPEIIPFDSVIDWLKNLQSILIRAQ